MSPDQIHACKRLQSYNEFHAVMYTGSVGLESRGRLRQDDEQALRCALDFAIRAHDDAVSTPAERMAADVFKQITKEGPCPPPLGHIRLQDIIAQLHPDHPARLQYQQLLDAWVLQQVRAGNTTPV